MVVVLVVVAGVAALALAVTAVVLDRLAATNAERRAADVLSVQFGTPATVRINGRPFLTQVARGRYGDVEVFGGGLRVGDMTGATLSARLRQVHLPLRAVLGRRIDELPCEFVSGDLVLPYGELARVARIPGLELRLSGERVVASAALPVPGVSQLVRITGYAVLSVRDGQGVWLRVRGVSVVGIAVPRLVLSQLLPALSVPIPLPDLPYGLRIDDLTPTQDGLVVTGSAEAVTFRAQRAG